MEKSTSVDGRNSEIFQISFYLFDDLKISHLMTKPTKWLCAQRRLRSAWACAQSDQSSLCTWWVAKDPSFLHAHREDSDQTGQADLSLRWAHMSFCWFCRAAVQMFTLLCLVDSSILSVWQVHCIQLCIFFFLFLFKYFDIKPCLKTIDPEHMPQSAVFYLGLHCLPWCW